MLSRHLVSHLKIIVFALTVSFPAVSCKTNDTQPQNKTENISNAPRNQPSLQETKVQLPFQTKARRKKITLPDDCQYFPNDGNSNWQLQLGCAEALDSVLSLLPQEDCDYESFQKAGGKFYQVIDDPQILIYTVEEKDTDDLAALAEKLGTTEDNIISNNKFYNQVKLSVGQELKYQKSHLEKSWAKWFDEYDLKFYSLSPNKYLIETRCQTGAYNRSNVYLLYDESTFPAKIKVLKFPSFKFDYDEDSDIAKSVEQVSVSTVGGIWFDEKDKKLIVFVKAHGIGDAGRYARYSFPNGKPKLEEFRARFKWSGREYTPDDVIKNPPRTWKKY